MATWSYPSLIDTYEKNIVQQAIKFEVHDSTQLLPEKK